MAEESVTAEEVYDYFIDSVAPDLNRTQVQSLVGQHFGDRPFTDEGRKEYEDILRDNFKDSDSQIRYAEPIRQLEDPIDVMSEEDGLLHNRRITNMVAGNMIWNDMSQDAAVQMTLRQLQGLEPINMQRYTLDDLTEEQKDKSYGRVIEIIDMFGMPQVDATMAEGPHRVTADKTSKDLFDAIEKGLDEDTALNIAMEQMDVMEAVKQKEMNRQARWQLLFGASKQRKKGQLLHKNVVFQEAAAIQNNPEELAILGKMIQENWLGIPTGMMKASAHMAGSTLVLDPAIYGEIAGTILERDGSHKLSVATQGPEAVAEFQNDEEFSRVAAVNTVLDTWEKGRESVWSEAVSSLETFDQLSNNKTKHMVKNVPRAYRPEARRIYNLYIETLKERDSASNNYAMALAAAFTSDQDTSEFLLGYEKKLREAGMKAYVVAEQLERLSNIKFDSGTWYKEGGGKTTWKDNFFQLERKFTKRLDQTTNESMWNLIDKDRLKHAMESPNTSYSDEDYDTTESSDMIDNFIFDNELSSADLPIELRRIDDKKDKTFFEAQGELNRKKYTKLLNKATDKYNAFIKQGYGTRRTIPLAIFNRAQQKAVDAENAVFSNRDSFEDNEKEYNNHKEKYTENLTELKKLIEEEGYPKPKSELFEMEGAGRLKEEYRNDPSWKGFSLIVSNEELLTAMAIFKKRMDRMEKDKVLEIMPFGQKLKNPESLKRLYKYPREIASEDEFYVDPFVDQDVSANELTIGTYAEAPFAQEVSPGQFHLYRGELLSRVIKFDDYIAELESNMIRPEGDVATEMDDLEHEIGSLLQKLAAERVASESHQSLLPGGSHPILAFENVARAGAYGPALDQMARDPQFVSLFGLELSDAMMTIDRGYPIPVDQLEPDIKMPLWYTGFQLGGDPLEGIDSLSGFLLPRKFKERKTQPQVSPIGEAKLSKDILKKENALRILDDSEFSDLLISLLSTTAEGQGEIEDPNFFKTQMTGGTLALGEKVRQYKTDPGSVKFTDDDINLLMQYMSMPILNTLQYKMFLYRTNKIAPHLVENFNLKDEKEWSSKQVFGAGTDYFPIPRQVIAPVHLFRSKAKGGTDLGFSYSEFANASKRSLMRTWASFATEKAAIAMGLPEESLVTREQKIDAAENYMNQRWEDVEDPDGLLNTNPNKFSQNLNLAVGAGQSLMQNIGSVTSEQDSTFDVHLRKLALSDPTYDEIFTGEGPLTGMTISQYPTYLQAEIRRTIRYRKGTTLENQTPPTDEYYGLTLSQVYQTFSLDLDVEDIIDFAQMRYATKNHLGTDFMYWMEDGSYAPVLNPNTGEMTYTTTSFGWYMNYIAPAAPRLVLESVKSGLHFVGGQHWEQKHDFTSRVFANLALGDIGAMGEFGYQVGRLGYEYDHPFRNISRMVGFGADIMVNWEGKVGFLPRAALRRGAVFLRTNQSLKNKNDFTAFGRTASLSGFVGGMGYALTGDVTTGLVSAVLPGMVTIFGDVKNFSKTKQSVSPLIAAEMDFKQRMKISFKTASYDMHLDFKPYTMAGFTMRTAKVIPYVMKKFGTGRNVLDNLSENRVAGILRGELSRVWTDLNHADFRNRVKGGMTPDDIMTHFMYTESFNMLKREDFWDTQGHIKRLKLTGKEKDRFKRSHEDFKTEIQAMALVLGVDPDKFVLDLRQDHYNNLSKVAVKAKMILEGDGKVSPMVRDLKGYKDLVRILDRKVTDNKMSKGERDLVWGMFLAASEITGDQTKFFQELNFKTESRGLPIDERMRTHVKTGDIISGFLRDKGANLTKEDIAELSKAIMNGVDVGRARRFLTSGALTSLRNVVADIDLAPVDKYLLEALREAFDVNVDELTLDQSALDSSISDSLTSRMKGINDDVMGHGGIPKAKISKNNKADYKSVSAQFNERVEKSHRLRAEETIKPDLEEAKQKAKQEKTIWNKDVKAETKQKLLADELKKKRIYPTKSAIKELDKDIKNESVKLSNYRRTIEEKETLGQKAGREIKWAKDTKRRIQIKRRQLKDLQHLNKIMSGIRDEQPLRNARIERNKALQAKRKETQSEINRLKDLKRKRAISQEEFDNKVPDPLPPTGNEFKARWSIDATNQAILRYNNDASSIILDSLSGTWFFKEDFENQNAFVANDYHFRQVVLKKLIEYAGHQGKDALYIPLGKQGIFHQIYGDGEQIGLRQKLFNEKKKIKAQDKQLNDLKKEDAIFAKAEAEYNDKLKLNRVEADDAYAWKKAQEKYNEAKASREKIERAKVNIETRIKDLEAETALKAEPDKIKALDNAVFKALEDQINTYNEMFDDAYVDIPVKERFQNHSSIVRDSAESFDKSSLIPGQEYIKITIRPSIRQMLLPNELSVKYSGPNFERLKSLPMPDNIDRVNITSPNLKSIFLQKEKEFLKQKTDDDIQTSLEQAKQERDDLISKAKPDALDMFDVVDPRQETGKKLADLRTRIKDLEEALTARQNANISDVKMRKMQAVYSNGTSAMVYSMTDNNGNVAMFQVRPSETLTKGSPTRNIMVIEDFAYQNAPSEFNRHSHTHAEDLQRRYFQLEEEHKNQKGKKETQKRIQQDLKKIKDEIVQYGYYNLMSTKMISKFDKGELNKAKSSASMYAHSIFRDITGEPRRVVNEFIKSAVADGFSGFAYKSSEHALGAAILDELRQAQNYPAIRAAQIDDSTAGYTFVHLGTAENKYRQRIEYLNGNAVKDGASKIIFDEHTANVHDAYMVGSAIGRDLSGITPKQRGDVQNMLKWLALDRVDEDVFVDRLLRSGHQFQEAYIRDYNGMTYADVVEVVTKTKSYLDKRRAQENLTKKKIEDKQTLLEKTKDEKTKEAIQEDIKIENEKLFTLQKNIKVLQASFDDFGKIQQQMKESPRITNSYYYSSPLPNGRHVRMPVFVNPDMLLEIQNQLSGGKYNELIDLENQIAEAITKQDVELERELSDKANLLEKELEGEIQVSQIEGRPHVFMESIIETKEGSQMSSGRKTLVINGLGFENENLHSLLMSNDEFVLPIVSRIAREAAENGFEAIALNMNVDPVLQPGLSTINASLEKIASKWDTNLSKDFIKTSRTTPSKNLVKDNPNAAKFNEIIAAGKEQFESYPELKSQLSKFKKEWDKIKDQKISNSAYEYLLINKKYKDLAFAFLATEVKFGGKMNEVAMTMPITEIMRRSLPQKGRKVQLRNEKYILKEDIDGIGELTRREDVIYIPEERERPFQAAMINELAFDPDMKFAIVDTPFARYQLEITERPAEFNPEIIRDIDHLFIEHPYDPEGLMQDSPYAKELMMTYDPESAKTIIRHVYYMKVMEDYAELLRKYNYTVKHGTPRTVFDKFNFDERRSLREERNYAQRTIDTPINSRSQFTTSRVFESAQRTGKINTDEIGQNHVYKTVAPIAHFDSGMTTLDHFALLDGIGLDDVINEMRLRLEDLKNGTATIESIQRSFTIANTKSELQPISVLEKNNSSIIRRGFYHETELLKVVDSKIMYDPKVVARLATKNELTELGYPSLSEANARKMIKNFQNALKEGPTKKLTDAETATIGAYLGFNKVSAEDVRKHIVRRERFVDINNLASFKNKELGEVATKSIKYKGQRQTVELPEPRSKLPFEDHMVYGRTPLFPLLAKEISANFETLDNFTPLNMHFEKSMQRPMRKLFDDLSDAELVESLGLTEQEGLFFQQKLQKYKLRGKEKLTEQQIFELPPDTSKQYDVDFTREEKAYIRQYNDDFEVVFDPDATFEDFLMANERIVEMWMPPTTKRIANGYFESKGGRLTSRGRKDFTQALYRHLVDNDPPPSGKWALMMSGSASYLDRLRAYFIKKQKEPARGSFSEAHSKLTPNALETWNAVFNPGDRAVNEAYAFWSGNEKFARKVTVSTKPDMPVQTKLDHERTIATKLSKAQIQMPEFTFDELMRELTNEAFDPYNPKIVEKAPGDWEIVPGQLADGSAINTHELFRRLFVIASNRRFKNSGGLRMHVAIAGGAGAAYRALTLRTAVPEEKVKSIQKNAQKFMDSLFRDGLDEVIRDAITLTTDEFLKENGFQVKEYPTGRVLEITEQAYDAFRTKFEKDDRFQYLQMPIVFRDKNEFLQKRAITKDGEAVLDNQGQPVYRLSIKEYNAVVNKVRLDPRQIVLLDEITAKNIVNAANNLASLPMGDIVPLILVDWKMFGDHRLIRTPDGETKYFVYNSELQDMSDAFIDTNAPMYAKRSRKLEGAPRTMLESLSNSLGDVFEDFAEEHKFDRFRRAWRGLKDTFITKKPFDHLPPDIAEILEKHRAILLGLVDELAREIKEFNDITPSKRTGFVWSMLKDYSEDFVPPIDTKLLPVFYKLKDRLESGYNELNSNVDPITLTELLSEDFLGNMETILNSGQKQMTIGEKNTLDSLRALKPLFESGNLSLDHSMKLGESIYALLIAFRRRERAMDKISDVIMMAIISSTPSKINPHLHPARHKALQRRAYTLFYEGRWAPTRTLMTRAFDMFEDVDAFESRLLTDLSVESVVEYLRDRGFTFSDTASNAVIDRVNRVIDEYNYSVATEEAPQKYYHVPDVGTVLDDAGKKQLLDSLNFLLSQESQKPRFRSLTEMSYELGARDLMDKDPNLDLYLTDPGRVFAEVLLNLRANQQRKKMWNEITKIRGELDLDQVILEYMDYGANPIRDEAQFKTDLLAQINDEMNFMAGNVVEEGLAGEAGTTIRASKQGKLKQLRDAVDDLEPGEEVSSFEMDDLEIFMNQAREVQSYEPDRELMIQIMAQDIIDRIGIKARGSHALDTIQEYTSPTGKTLLLPTKTIDAIRDAEEAILAGGRQIGTVTATDFSRVLRQIDGETLRAAQDIAFESKDKDQLKATFRWWERAGANLKLMTLLGKKFNDMTAEELLTYERMGRDADRMVAGFESLKNWDIITKTLQEEGKLDAYGKFVVLAAAPIGGAAGAIALGGGGIAASILGFTSFALASKMYRSTFQTAVYAGAGQQQVKAAGEAIEALGDVFAKRIADEKRDGFSGRLEEEISKIERYEAQLDQQHRDAQKAAMKKRQKFQDKITEKQLRQDFETLGKDPDGPEFTEEIKKQLKDKRLDVVFAKEYYKNLRYGYGRWFTEGAINLLTPENITSAIKMSVTVGVGTIPYYVANIFGMMQQLLMAKLSEPFVFNAAVGGIVGVATGGVGSFLTGAGIGALTGQALHPYLTEARTPKGATMMHRPKQVMGLMMNRSEYLRRGGAMVAPMAAVGALGGAVTAGATGGLIGAAALGAVGYGLTRKYKNPYKYLSHRPGESYDIPPVITPDGKIYFASDLARMIEEHQLGSTYLKAETGTILVKSIDELHENSAQKFISWFGGKRYRKMLVEVAEAHDSYVRIQAFLDLLEEGYRPREAAIKVRNAMFDYSDLTDFEKNVLRQVFLFYSFMRKNTEFVLATMMKNPERIHAFMRMRRDMLQMAFDSTESELMIDRWWNGRFIFPFLQQPVQPSQGEGRGVPHAGIIDKFVLASPMTNDFDFFGIVTNLRGFVGLGSSSGPTQSEAAGYFSSMVHPALTKWFEIQYGKTNFGGIPLQKTRANSQAVVQMARLNRMRGKKGQFMYNTNPKDKGGLFRINLKPVDIKKHFPVFDEMMKNMDNKSKKRVEALSKMLQNPEGNPVLDMMYYEPRTTSDGIKLRMLDEVIMPGIAAQIPILSLVTGMTYGRGGNVASQFDRGDLGQWMLGSQSVTEMLNLLGFKTTDQIFQEAKDLNYGKAQTREYFAAYYHNLAPNVKLDDLKGLYDVYIRPEGLPPEIYYAKILGMRYIPVRTKKQAAREAWNQAYRKIIGF